MNKILIFSFGVAVGSLATWKIVEEKYKRLADEEIASVIEVYRNKEKNLKIKEEIHEEINDEEHYEDLVEDLGYSKSEEDQIAPYVIAPEEYCEIEEYESKSWTYYSDFVLVDEMGDIVFDPESIIGDALEHFGDYEDDSVYVRNENLECDYEILKNEKTFSEINGEES